MLLLGETGGGVPVQVNLQVNAQTVRRVEALGDFAAANPRYVRNLNLFPTL
jgi:hypothetical protein